METAKGLVNHLRMEKKTWVNEIRPSGCILDLLVFVMLLHRSVMLLLKYFISNM